MLEPVICLYASLAITSGHLSFCQRASFGVQVRDIRIIINIDDIVLIKSCGAYVILYHVITKQAFPSSSSSALSGLEPPGFMS